MTKRDQIFTAAAMLMLGLASATAGELPNYDFAGLPTTPLQMSVLGQSGRVHEQAAAAMLLREGMPASPHQIAVLTRRPQTAAQSAAAETQISIVTRSQ